jgi:hypothetical protein
MMAITGYAKCHFGNSTVQKDAKSPSRKDKSSKSQTVKKLPSRQVIYI